MVEYVKIFGPHHSQIPDVLDTEVVVIGTGAGGATAAAILSEKFKVIMLEEGPYRTDKDFDMHESKALSELYQDSGSRFTADQSIKILQGRSVGGSTTVNWTSSFRIPSQTLKVWNDVYGIDSLKSETMAPIFDEVEKQFSISKWDGTPNQNNQMIADGMKKLGIQYDYIPRNVKGCYDLGHCGHGCPTKAKQSTLVTMVPKALENGAELYYQFRALNMVQSNSKITEVRAIAVDEYGKEIDHKQLVVKAKYVVLAGGGINSPILMMRSNLPDPYMNLGHRTFLHPVTISLARFPERIDGFAGAPQSVYSDHFLWPEDERMGFKIESAPIHPALTSSLLHYHGEFAAEIMRSFRHFQAAIALSRDGFHQDSVGGKVVVLKNGRFGLDYAWTDYLVESYKRSLKTLAAIQLAAGALEVLPLHKEAKFFKTIHEVERFLMSCSSNRFDFSVVSAHVMGGCAIGADPKKSVVDSYGRHHQIENLFVFDGSVFPTSLGVNPMETILAVSTIFSRKMIQDYR